MKVDAVSQSSVAHSVTVASNKGRSLKDSTETVADFSQSQSLNASYSEETEIRSEAVARARQMIAQQDYPSTTILSSMADLFARSLR